jgi:hypothetical protein
MKIGDIVEIKSDHHLKEFFPGACVVLEIAFKERPLRQRMFISTLAEKEGERNLTWVYDDELLTKSERRDSILKSIGI